jgi:hypothetical protein
MIEFVFASEQSDCSRATSLQGESLMSNAFKPLVVVLRCAICVPAQTSASDTIRVISRMRCTGGLAASMS